MMKTMILELGADAFHANVVKTFDDHKEAYWYEQNLIKESISNPKCLNKHFVERDSGKRVFCGLQGVPKTAEHRRKLSEANKGKHDDPALRERMIAPQRGKTLSDEHKAKLSKASRGFKHTEETKKLMSLNSSRNKSFLGRKHSDETKAKMSDRAIGRKPFLGRKHSDETKAKMRAYHEARRLQKLSTT
jgi:hypothetical protein